MNLRTTFLWCISFIVVTAISAFAQNTNLLSMGGFESGKPSLYGAEAGTSGATLTWAEDQKHSGTRSLKIVKAATTGSARWVSGNNVRYWVDKVGKGVDIKIGAWVKTNGVNISTAVDARWTVKFAFYDTNMVIIGAPVALDVDQSVATKDWYADTNGVGSVILPKDAYKVIISAEAGANATGTVWFDDFIFVGRGGAWAGQNWNGFVDASEGWQYWLPPNGGNDGLTYFPASGVTTDQKRTGDYSLKIAAFDGHNSQDGVFFTETVPVTGGKNYAASVWIKTSQIKKDSVFKQQWGLKFVVTWHSKLFTDGGGWNQEAGTDYFIPLKDTASDWTQYSWILSAPTGKNIVGASLRAGAWNNFQGISYWDDMELQPLSDVNLTSSMGGIESGKPSLYGAEAGTSGATLTWAEDQKHSGTRSLKIVKAATTGSARWVSGNNVRYWVDKVGKGVDIKIGAWVKTNGVNISTAVDARWTVKFAFYDTNMVIIGAPVALDVDQSVATKDWYADTNGVGSVILPKDAYKVIISAEAGANATGTVWFDDFIFVGRGGAWAGQNWNGFVDASEGWQYWLPPNGGNDGLTYFPASGVTTDQKRTGDYSLKIAAFDGHNSQDGVFFTETVPVTGGKNYAASVWIKTSQIKKDSVFKQQWGLKFVVTWHSKLFTDGGGWNQEAGTDYFIPLKDTASDWTQYSWILSAPTGKNIVGASLRAGAWNNFQGISYWDDLVLNEIVTGFVATYSYTLSGKIFSLGIVKVGTIKDTTFTISNTGNQPLVISEFKSNSPTFVVKPAQQTIALGGTQKDTIRFSPTAVGNITAKIVIISNSVPDTISVSGNATLTGVAEDLPLPTVYSIAQNFPNPFNPTTMINYQLPMTNHVSLKVYDAIGREVATLVNEVKEAGSYSAQFDASKFSSGIYFYMIKAGNFTATKKLVLIK